MLAIAVLMAIATVVALAGAWCCRFRNDRPSKRKTRAGSARSNYAMRFAMLCVGSQGDLHVFCSLGLELRRRGHNVLLIAEESFKSAVESLGLEFGLIEQIGVKKNMETRYAKAFVQAGESLFRVLVKYARNYKFDSRDTEHVLRSARSQCLRWKPDAIVFGSFSTGGFDLAEFLGVPAVMLYLAPKTPTSRFPMHLLQLPAGHVVSRVGALCRLSYFVYDWAAWRPLRPTIDRFRRELGLKALPWWSGPRERAHRLGMLTVYSYPECVVPRPCDWRSSEFVAGFFAPLPQPDWQPPRVLTDFLADCSRRGQPPFYIGFGSMVVGQCQSQREQKGDGERSRATPLQPQSQFLSDALAAAVLGAVADTGVRAVVLRGWGALALRASRATDDQGSTADGKRPSPGAELMANGTVLVIDSVCHEWLLPRCYAAVHHAGAGTTAAVLRAGLPSVSVPFAFDQLLYGERLHALGAGCAPIVSGELTRARLAAALRRLLDEKQYASMRGAAQRLQKQLQVQAEDQISGDQEQHEQEQDGNGSRRAADWIEKQLQLGMVPFGWRAV